MRLGRGGSGWTKPDKDWSLIEQYIARHFEKHSSGHSFGVDDLVTVLATEPVLLALDDLDQRRPSGRHRSTLTVVLVTTWGGCRRCEVTAACGYGCGSLQGGRRRCPIQRGVASMMAAISPS